MRRGAQLTDRDKRGEERQPLPPLATGVALGLWVTVMVVLALVVVPTAFASCVGPPPP